MNPLLPRICIGPEATIRRAMEVIAQGGVEISLVVGRDGHMVGTVSDGDIRRALLSGASLDDQVLPFAAPNFTSVREDADRVWVLDLMKARFITQVPILDGDGRVVGLHLWREILGAQARPNVAVILAGGRGTRLLPHTESLPKPMVKVAGRPILERLVLHLVGAGIRTIYLAVNYMRETIEHHFRDGAEFGCSITYLREDPDHPLGTAGALSLLPDEIRRRDDSVLVLNGDLVTDFEVDRFLAAHERDGSIATIGVKEYVHNVPFGVLRIENGRVAGLDEKPAVTWQVNAGVYALDPVLLGGVPEGEEVSMTDLLHDCIRRGKQVGVHLLEGDWVDIGRPEELRHANGMTP